MKQRACGNRGKHREANARWKGGKVLQNGYILVKVRSGNTTGSSYAPEHRLIAERVLGKPLPPGAIVHHINEDKTDNRNENLVICEDKNYHKLIHQRMRAYKVCGHADWRKCPYCKKYGDVSRMLKQTSRGGAYYHQVCAFRYRFNRARIQGLQLRRQENLFE